MAACGTGRPRRRDPRGGGEDFRALQGSAGRQTEAGTGKVFAGDGGSVKGDLLVVGLLERAQDT